MNELRIIYENNHLLAVDKPAGIICFPENDFQKNEPSVASMLEGLTNCEAPRHGIAHRLDKETSGILLVAKDEGTLHWLQKAFEGHDIEKHYTALVCGIIPQSEGEIDAMIGRNPADRTKQKAFLSIDPLARKKGSREAKTIWKKLKEYTGFTLIEAIPKTGRRHQIRIHFQFIGHPLAGDKIYSYKDNKTPQGLTRHFLHASLVKFKTPDGQEIKIASELPEDLDKVIKSL